MQKDQIGKAKMAAVAPCLVIPCKPKTLSHVTSSVRCCTGALPRRLPVIKTLAFSSNLSSVAFPNGGTQIRALEKPKPMRRSVVCEAATTKKPDSASKRARQAEKRRIYNKAKKSEVKTRMRKVLEELDILKKKTDAKAEEIRSVEELIAKAYSAIDKAVKSGTLHKNTGAHRKSRLARRKKTVEIHHGWYIPAVTA